MKTEASNKVVFHYAFRNHLLAKKEKKIHCIQNVEGFFNIGEIIKPRPKK